MKIYFEIAFGVENQQTYQVCIAHEIHTNYEFVILPVPLHNFLDTFVFTKYFIDTWAKCGKSLIISHFEMAKMFALHVQNKIGSKNNVNLAAVSTANDCVYKNWEYSDYKVYYIE